MLSDLADFLERALPWLMTAGVLLIGGVIAIRRVGGQDEGAVPTRFLRLIDAQRSEMDAQIVRRDARIDVLELDGRITRQWIAMLTAQIVMLGGNPVTERDAASALGLTVPGSVVREQARPGVPPNPQDVHDRLRRVLAERFSLGEMASLGMSLGYDPESIGGGTLPERAAAMVDYARRRGQLPQLKAAIERERPGALAQE